MLSEISDYKKLRQTFDLRFRSVLQKSSAFKEFFYTFSISSSSFVVGGFIRDIVNRNKPRDMDLMVEIDVTSLLGLLNKSGLDYQVNRMGGIKILLGDFNVDMWTVDNNWAFKRNVVKRNDLYMVERIAGGCFYNYDSLVIHVNKTKYLSVSNYNDCVKTNTLDILRKGDSYIKTNPTVEANILRAYFLKKRFGLQYSEKCVRYIASSLSLLKSLHQDVYNHLEIYREKYIKYRETLNKEDIVSYSKEIFLSDYNSINGEPSSQGKLNF